MYLQIRTSVLMSVAYFRVCFFMYPARKRETKMNIKNKEKVREKEELQSLISERGQISVP